MFIFLEPNDGIWLQNLKNLAAPVAGFAFWVSNRVAGEPGG